MNKLGIETVGPRTVVTMGMRDFGGFKSGDQNTLKALLTFSYHATTGNMDEAFKSIKAVKRYKHGQINKYFLSGVLSVLFLYVPYMS